MQESGHPQPESGGCPAFFILIFSINFCAGKTGTLRKSVSRVRKPPKTVARYKPGFVSIFQAKDPMRTDPVDP